MKKARLNTLDRRKTPLVLLKVTTLLILFITVTLNAFCCLGFGHVVQTKELWLWKLIMRMRQMTRRCDANLVIKWSHNNPHAKTPIPGKPSKPGLIGVWHKDNFYLGTSTIGNRNPHPRNIDSRTRSIRMTPQNQLFFDKLFFSVL
jgi:hypothetical protein